MAHADRQRPAPHVGVVVGDPAAGPVQGARHLRALLGEPVQQVEQRLVALAEPGRLGAPVVHLGVDVDGVVRRPRWPQVLVPDALEVGGRSGARPGRGRQQVAAELEHHGGGEPVVAPAEHLAGHVVGARPAWSDPQRGGAQQGAQVRLVGAQQLLRAALGGPGGGGRRRPAGAPGGWRARGGAGPEPGRAGGGGERHQGPARAADGEVSLVRGHLAVGGEPDRDRPDGSYPSTGPSA